ncbi:MAG: DUF4238 domain-containing protein [bacterium]
MKNQKNREHKKQHYIPQCYLKPWCDLSCPKDHTPYLWQFTKDGNIVKKKAPINLFYESEMYTIHMPNESRDIKLEKGLNQLETAFSNIRDNVILPKKIFEPKEKYILCTFIAAMQSRTRLFREHQRNQWGKIFDMMNRMKQWAEQATLEQKKQMSEDCSFSKDNQSSLSYEAVEQIVKYPTQTLLIPMIEASAPLLNIIDFAIFATNTLPGFITSDHPCVWFDPLWYTRPPLFQSPALAYETIEITMPISPYFCVYLNRQGLNGYIEINENALNEINRRTRHYAHEYFIVNQNVKKDIWFDLGKPPKSR